MRAELLDRFARLVGPADAELPLFDSAMAYAECIQDGVPWPASQQAMGDLAAEVIEVTASLTDDREIAITILETLTTRGFRGDSDHYEDVRNSLLDRVLERKLGIPISLSVLLLHLADRCGIGLRGIAFPGHFLVGMDFEAPNPLILDAFAGREIGLDRVAALYSSTTGHPVGAQDAELRAHLAPAHSRLILTRMLQNLRRHHRLGGSHERAADALELLSILHPGQESIRSMHQSETRRRDLLN